ncbi:MAG: hypothetical protein HWE18_11390 [Gammaproteobacteria bacterium]|nr:hypothetical protein [Gammaproteobacteria bacterium]
MKYIYAFLISAFFIVSQSQADDTEIYGANAIDINQRVNSNVLFIMDTSGSMGTDSGTVSTAKPPYNNATTYSGSYRQNQFYHSLYASPDHGHNNSTLTSSLSSNCSNTISNLSALGVATGYYAQAKYKGNGNFKSWDRLQNGSNNPITCNSYYYYKLYSGNYLNYFHDTTYDPKTRLEVVVNVVNELTQSLSNINLGLMRFDRYSEGGYIDVPVSDISTSGPLIRTALSSYIAAGGTPLSETLYEAVRYYRSEEWQFGSSSSPSNSVSTSLKADGKTYNSPITAECQKNHIILLTDGEPSSDTSANAGILNYLGNMDLPPGLSTNCSSSGCLLDELAYWAKNTDNATDQIGNQEITTYTIGGFGLENGVDLLTRTANYGGGKYFPANDTVGLTAALDSIFLDILSTDSTFTAPAVSVNAFNASEHRDELFYALFRPDDKIKWTGNVKRYHLTSDGIVVGKQPSSSDPSNVPAISEATGFFNEGTFDFWNNTNTADGKNVSLGGAANRFTTPSARKIYTENTSGQLVALSSSGGASKTTFGMENATDDEYQEVLDWTLGIDTLNYDGDNNYTESRQQLGDPLHSEPVVITYGGTEDNPDSTIYFGTNEGFIHGVDTETGEEDLAFIPRALHSIQNTYFTNNLAAGNKPYGMDGLITSWFYDKNRNNLLIDPDTNTAETGEHVYIYSGMRRGGRNYYALDVTDRSNPELLFKIEGGVTTGFDKLGQTWSRMTVAKVKYNGAVRFVLFFTGGYDDDQDNNNTAQADDVGNAIYMVDAKTGELLWTASNENANTNIPQMINSMPASVSAIDITGDGNVDYLFAADTGGRVFRIDIKQNNAGSADFAKGGLIASLAGTDADNNRRFYNKPNVALVKDKQYGDYLTIAIGSGYRAHPISVKNVENRFYVIKDFNPYSAPSTYVTKTEAPTDKVTLGENENADPSKLYNATALMNNGKSSLTTSMQRIMNNGGGWYVTFATEGEKVLAESTTFSGAIIFTTFSPTGVSSNACGADTGASRIYILGQTSAMAEIDLDGDGDLDENDTSKVLAHSGIAPRPVVIYRSGGGKTIAIGTETIDDDRFNETPPDPDCAENGTCPEKEQKCTTGNCYVVPQYWRQNEVSN